jgi:hypothetical protein
MSRKSCQALIETLETGVTVEGAGWELVDKIAS